MRMWGSVFYVELAKTPLTLFITRK